MSVSRIHDARLTLYLVEPSVVIAEALTNLLADRVRTLKYFPNAESLLGANLILAPRRCLITELHLSGMNGIDLMLALERENLSTPTIIMALEANIFTAVSAIRQGAFDFIEKPSIATELLDGLSRIEESWI